jgi:putative SOS response-associated peptidase YedK
MTNTRGMLNLKHYLASPRSTFYSLFMCGRYRLSRHKQVLAERFDVEIDDNWQPRYNIAPTQDVPVIRQERTRPKRLASTMRWGLIPYWAKNASAGHKMINARAESISSRPAFQDALKKRRCLLPADGFYEWKKTGAAKTPFCFTMADEGIFAFAGIWDSWRNPEGKLVETCCIITTAPNALCAQVHDRMPVILPGEAYDLWLDPGWQKPEVVSGLLQPFDAGLMRCYEASPRVNFVKNDDVGCAEPAGALTRT